MQHYIAGNKPIAAEWLPRAKLEARYGFSKTTGNRLIAEQLIEARKVGALVIVNVQSVERYLAAQPRPSIRSDDRSRKLAHRAA